jgi:hypothetical protein
VFDQTGVGTERAGVNTYVGWFYVKVVVEVYKVSVFSLTYKVGEATHEGKIGFFV